VRGYQAIFVPLAALSSPGYSPVGGQPAVYFSLSHKHSTFAVFSVRVSPGDTWRFPDYLARPS
jgi:hypothetical protein